MTCPLSHTLGIKDAMNILVSSQFHSLYLWITIMYLTLFIIFAILKLCGAITSPEPLHVKTYADMESYNSMLGCIGTVPNGQVAPCSITLKCDESRFTAVPRDTTTTLAEVSIGFTDLFNTPTLDLEEGIDKSARSTPMTFIHFEQYPVYCIPVVGIAASTIGEHQIFSQIVLHAAPSTCQDTGETYDFGGFYPNLVGYNSINAMKLQKDTFSGSKETWIWRQVDGVISPKRQPHHLFEDYIFRNDQYAFDGGSIMMTHMNKVSVPLVSSDRGTGEGTRGYTMIRCEDIPYSGADQKSTSTNLHLIKKDEPSKTFGLRRVNMEGLNSNTKLIQYNETVHGGNYFLEDSEDDRDLRHGVYNMAIWFKTDVTMQYDVVTDTSGVSLDEMGERLMNMIHIQANANHTDRVSTITSTTPSSNVFVNGIKNYYPGSTVIDILTTIVLCGFIVSVVGYVYIVIMHDTTHIFFRPVRVKVRVRVRVRFRNPSMRL